MTGKLKVWNHKDLDAVWESGEKRAGEEFWLNRTSSPRFWWFLKLVEFGASQRPISGQNRLFYQATAVWVPIGNQSVWKAQDGSGTVSFWEAAHLCFVSGVAFSLGSPKNH